MASSPSKGSKSSGQGPLPPSRPPVKKSGGRTASKAAANVAAKRTTKPAAAVPLAPAPTFGMSTLDKVVWFSLQALIFLVPIAMSNANFLAKVGLASFALPFTYDQFDIVKVFVMRACAIVALGAWSFQFFFKGGTIRRTKLDWLILVFLGWVLVTSFTSISVSTALFGKYRRFEGFFSFLTYAVVYFLVVQLADRPGRMRSLARTLMLSGFIVSFYGVLQHFGLDPVNWGANLPFEANRSFATFGNPDLLGGFLVFPLVISVALALSERDNGWRIFYWTTFLVTALCWIFAFVRGAWIGGAVGLLVLGVAAFLAKPKLHVIDWSFLGASVGGGLVYAVYNSMTSTNEVMNVWARLQSIFKFGEGSALTRFEIWESAVNAIKARPITGFGADTFRLVFPKYKPVAYVKDAGYLSVADNVHDYPLQLMAGIGIVGFLLLYGIFTFAFVVAAPNAFARGKGTERLLVAGFWAAALGYIVHLFFGLSVTGSTIFLWMALGMIMSPTAREQEFKAPSWGPIVSIALLVVLGVAWVGNFIFIVADNFFLRGQLASSSGANPISLTETAIRLNPYNDIYRAMLGKAYEQQMLSWLNQANSESSSGQDPTASIANATTSFEAAEKTFKETIAMVPTEYDNYLFISSLYNEAGAYLDPKYLAKGLEWADKGIAVEPFGPGVRLQKAVAQASVGDDTGAVATLEQVVAKDKDGNDIRVLDMDPNFTDIHMFYAQTLQRLGRLEEAADAYRYLVERNPGNTTYSSALEAVEASLSAQPTGTK